MDRKERGGERVEGRGGGRVEGGRGRGEGKREGRGKKGGEGDIRLWSGCMLLCLCVCQPK